MNAPDFQRLSQDLLHDLDEKLGELDPDRLDVELAGDVMTLSFDDGVKFILNAHSAAGQIWLAAHTSAWHFDPPKPPQTHWIAQRSDDELYQTLERVIGKQLGTTVQL